MERVPKKGKASDGRRQKNFNWGTSACFILHLDSIGFLYLKRRFSRQKLPWQRTPNLGSIFKKLFNRRWSLKWWTRWLEMWRGLQLSHWVLKRWSSWWTAWRYTWGWWGRWRHVGHEIFKYAPFAAGGEVDSCPSGRLQKKGRILAKPSKYWSQIPI